MVWKNPFAATPRAIAPAGHAIRQLGVPQQQLGVPQQQQQAQAEPLSDDPQAKSLIGSAIDTGLGGISAAANILDIPGSAVRDVLALENPFDQFLPWNWTSGQGRTSGRDLLEKWGALGKNKPGLDWGDVVGFGAEVGLDPLSYVGIGALSKAGKAAAAAGSLGRASTATAKRLGKSVDDIGKGYAQRSTTLRESLKDFSNQTIREKAPDGEGLAATYRDIPVDELPFDEVKLKRAKAWAEKKGIKGDDFEKLLDTPLGGSARFKVPLIGDEIMFGAGGNAMDDAALATGKALTRSDELKRNIGKRYRIKKGLSEWAAKRFNFKVQGKGTTRNQRIAARAYEKSNTEQLELHNMIVGAAEQLQHSDLMDEKTSWLIRSALELGDRKSKDIRASLPGALVGRTTLMGELGRGPNKPLLEIVENLREATDNLTERQRMLGTHTELTDPAEIRHVGRKKTKPDEQGADAVFRHEYLKGFFGGTEQLELGIIRSKKLNDVIVNAEAAAKSAGKSEEKIKKAATEAAAQWITREHRGNFLENYIDFKPKAEKEAGGYIFTDPKAKGKERYIPISRLIDTFRKNAGEPTILPDGMTIKSDKSFVSVPDGKLEPSIWNIDGGLKPKVKSRANELAKWLVENPEHRAGGSNEGLFGIHILNDAYRSLFAGLKQTQNNDLSYDFIAQNIIDGTRTLATKEGESTVADAFNKIGVKNHREAEKVLRLRIGADLSNSLKDLTKLSINKAEFDDWFREMKHFNDDSKPEYATKLWLSLTNLFKAGVLGHPARFTRDYVSAYARLVEQGAFSMRHAKDAQSVMLGKGSKEAGKIPHIQQMLREKNLPNDEAGENATRMLRVLFGAYGPGKHNIRSDIAELGMYDPQRKYGRELDDILAAMPRKDPTTRREQALNVMRTILGRTDDTSWWDFRKTRGVMEGKDATLRPTTEFGAFRASEQVGGWTDAEPRLAGFMKLMSDGLHPEEAMRRIEDMHVNYDPATFTPTEHTLKRFLPFYSFLSRQTKFVARHLREKPGGFMAQTLRASNVLRDDEFPTPAAVRDTMAIPWKTLPDGSQRYLAGLGLMHEGVLGLTPTTHEGFMGSGGEFFRGLGSQLHPVLKGIGELATGQSLFRGTDLEDLDPTIGRTMRNVQQLARNPAAAIVGGETERMPPVGSTRALDFVLGHSPLSRVLSSARTATDPRKDAISKLLNLTTGLRFYDASVPAQEGIMRDAITDLMRDRGAREFARPYFSDMKKEAMSEEQLEEAELLQELMKGLDRRQRARKKTKGE